MWAGLGQIGGGRDAGVQSHLFDVVISLLYGWVAFLKLGENCCVLVDLLKKYSYNCPLVSVVYQMEQTHALIPPLKNKQTLESSII